MEIRVNQLYSMDSCRMIARMDDINRRFLEEGDPDAYVARLLYTHNALHQPSNRLLRKKTRLDTCLGILSVEPIRPTKCLYSRTMSQNASECRRLNYG